jgi:purine-binding chemotaxis protein CheW
VSDAQRAASGGAAELRREFDAAFGAPPAQRGAAVASFLALKVGDDGYALRVQEASGLAAARKIVPLPGAPSALLGLAGIRGLVVPVFSLASAMGYGGDVAPRWFVLCGGADPIAFAFAAFDGYLELPASDVRRVDERESGRAHVREVFRVGGELRGVIALPSVTKAVRERGDAAGPTKER